MADMERQWKSQEWKTPPFRQKIVAQIDEAIRQSGNPINKNSAEMENHVFNKAKDKDEYLSYVARLILHVREMSSSNKPTNQGPANPNGMPIGSSPNPDPINALQSMARQEGPLSAYFPGSNLQLNQVLTTQNSHLNSNLASQNPQLGAALANQATLGATSNPPSTLPQASLMGLGVGHQAQIQTSQNLSVNTFGGMVTGMPGQQQQRMPLASNTVLSGSVPLSKVTQKQLSSQQQAKVMQSMQQQIQTQQQISQQPQNMPPPKPGTSMNQLQPGLNETLMLLQREQVSSTGSAQFGNQNIPQVPRQATPNQFHRQSPGPTQQVGGHSTMVPSPVQQMPGNLTASQMAPSPAGYLPSQSPQIVASPVSVQSVNSQSAGRTPGMVSSPGSVLNTPMMVGAVASPMSRNQEDQAYLEKVKQLSKYIEPLRKMIARIEKDEDKTKESSKMKNLLDILSNPNKRLQMETLLKCEQVLEKLELKVKSNDPGMMATSLPPPAPQSKEYNICQPLYDAVYAHISLPTFSHTLQRTFGPAIAALHGEILRRSPVSKRRKIEDDIPDVPDILQGEIARLDRRFKVTMSPLQNIGSHTVHLICQLDDKNLPCVPPITIIVPESYPKQVPLCDSSSEDYGSTQFLQSIHSNLLGRLSKMPEQYSVTSLLDTWEMSVRQACAPISNVTLSPA